VKFELVDMIVVMPSHKASVRQILVAGTWLFGLTYVGILSTFVVTGGCEESGDGVSPEEANGRIHQKLNIPTSAKDVNFVSTVWASWADFSISEPEFRSWCLLRRWDVIPIPAESALSFQSVVDRELRPRTVDDGLSFSAMNGDLGYSGVFDRKLQRACIWFTSR
jgi:hypothetical protein